MMSTGNEAVKRRDLKLVSAKSCNHCPSSQQKTSFVRKLQLLPPDIGVAGKQAAGGRWYSGSGTHAVVAAFGACSSGTCLRQLGCLA